MRDIASDAEEEDLGLADVFPEEARPSTPPATVVTYTRKDGRVLDIRLVNKHPLWGHVLYPTSICLADFLTANATMYVKSRRVLELGAGGGLPSLVAALEGATEVVVTDFPDADLIDNLNNNISTNVPNLPISAQGYTWGTKTAELGQFDTILAADLVFNHSQHAALLRTCAACLHNSGNSALLLFYSHHRPTAQLIAKDRSFAELAVSQGWTYERVLEDKSAGPAFPEDEGDLDIRSTVHGFLLQPPR